MGSPDRDTADLFDDYVPPPASVGMDPGEVRGSRLASRISQAVAVALKQSGRSRAEIAALMGERLGAPVSESMLDAYASQAKETHKITLERFLALIEVTGALKLVGFVAEQFELVAVPKRYRAIIELHQIEEAQQRLAMRKAAVQALVGKRR